MDSSYFIESPVVLNNTPSTSLKLKLCKVCGDHATKGPLLCGGRSCGGCARFFGRQSEKGEPSECELGGKCEITPDTRTNCAACRFNKCLEIGMSNGPLWSSLEDGSPCIVCGNQATVLYFGVQSCGECKDFFKRHKRSDQPLECQLGGECGTSPKMRKQCKACRFKKCLEAGMKDDVSQSPSPAPEDKFPSWHSLVDGKLGSILKSPTQDELLDFTSDSITSPLVQTSTVPTPRATSNKPPTVAEQIIRAHEDYNDYTTEKLEKIVPKAYCITTRISSPLVNRLNGWQIYSHEIGWDFEKTEQFLNHLARFKELNLDDKALLLKENYFPMFLMRWSRGFTDKGLLLHDGRLLDRATLGLLYGAPLLERVVKLAKKIALLTDAEIAHFTTFMLCQPAPENEYRSPSKVREVCAYYKGIVKDSLATDTYRRVLTLLIADLTDLKESHYEMLDFLRKYARFLELPPTFINLFDIKKRDSNAYEA